MDTANVFKTFLADIPHFDSYLLFERSTWNVLDNILGNGIGDWLVSCIQFPGIFSFTFRQEQAILLNFISIGQSRFNSL